MRTINLAKVSKIIIRWWSIAMRMTKILPSKRIRKSVNSVQMTSWTLVLIVILIFVRFVLLHAFNALSHCVAIASICCKCNYSICCHPRTVLFKSNWFTFHFSGCYTANDSGNACCEHCKQIYNLWFWFEMKISKNPAKDEIKRAKDLKKLQSIALTK